MTELAVVIINYKTAAMTCRCAERALRDVAALDAKVVIVDNFSADGSVRVLEEWRAGRADSDRIILKFSDRNTGFSGGNNIGIAAVDAPFYILLNSDTLVLDGAFPALLAAARRNPGCGFVAPALVSEDGERQISCFRQFTPISELIIGSALEAVRRAFVSSDVPIPVADDTPPGWVSFACVLLRREMIDDIGPMDEGYFLYFEDADYCRTAASHGWKILLAPEARVIHLRGGSSTVKSDEALKKRLPAYYYASRARYYRKFYGTAGFFLANFLWYIGRALAHSKRLFLKAPARACEKAARDIWITKYSVEES